MTSEVRGEFHRELDRLDIAVGGLLGLVPEAVVAATTALLVSDESTADSLQRWQVLVADMYRDVEHTIEVVVARQSPVAGDLRFLLACIRLVPGLHEVMDLISDVAAPSHRAIGEHLTPRVISLTEQLGELTGSTWEAVEVGWRTREPRRTRVVRERLELAASAERASGGPSTAWAITPARAPAWSTRSRPEARSRA
jgi:phosphate transport system protein